VRISCKDVRGLIDHVKLIICRDLTLGASVAANSVSDQSHDYMCLNFRSNLAASVSLRDLGGGVVGCCLQLICISGFDLVA
jgi:hypothetical protein